MAAQRAQRGSGVARRERAALVGLIAGRARRHEAERSLEELAALAARPAADVVLRVLQERPRPIPPPISARQDRDARRVGRGDDVDVVDLDNELDARAAPA